ncbi:ET module [Cooperia oncophora]
MINNCLTVEPGVRACCCNTDACLTPTRKPGNVLWCYVGLSAPKAGINVGGEVVCDGQCSSLSAIINGDNVTTFQCAPTTICRSTPQRHHLYRSIRFLAGAESTSTNNAQLLADSPNFASGPECGRWWLQDPNDIGQNHNATVYMCDPTAVCQALNMSNTCMSMEVGLSGCCCNEDACLTPTKSPLNNPLTCYVGLNAPGKLASNVGSVVSVVVCNGMCSSLNAIVNGDNVTTFQCVSRSVCKSFGLGVGYGCQTLRGDREVTGCCCDNGNGCNLAARPDIIQPTLAPYVEFPISCWSGVYVNGVPLSRPGYQSCNGECASLTLVTTINQVTHNATMYTCDPSSVCKALKMYNQCTTLETGLSGCCCDTDACLNPTRVPGRPLWCYVGLIAKKAGVNVGAETCPTNAAQSSQESADVAVILTAALTLTITSYYPGNPLVCYVGIYYEKDNYSVGSEMPCNGQCASLQTTFGGKMLKSYHCASTQICKQIADNDCTKIYKDTDVTGCCCNNANNCNVKESISTNNTVPPFTGTPIACQSGIYVDGVAIANDNAFIACKGQCAKLSYATNLTGVPHVLDLYTCDPASVCSGLGLSNSCASIDGTNVSGCCCTYDGCVTPSSNPTAPTGSSAVPTIFMIFIAAVYTLLRQ